MSSVVSVRLKVSEALPEDVGRGLARIDPADLARLGLQWGDFVEVVGKRPAVAKLWRAANEQKGQSRVRLDGLARENAGVSLDEAVTVRSARVSPARLITLTPADISLRECDLDFLSQRLDGVAVTAGDRLRVPLFGSRKADLLVDATDPTGAVVVGIDTKLALGNTPGAPTTPHTAYEDIGGLRRELVRVREIVELPLRFPELFERLGIDAPKGVLLHGPPGCGKTQIARAVAHETNAHFRVVNGPEIIDKMYGASEANLRQVFEEARKHAPAIIFIDEIDAIAPRRGDMSGDRQIEHRVVAQLLALMDGLDRRQKVIVIAATNLPDALDPALRRPGRFDREIAVPVPDRVGRLEIIGIHSRGMPLSADVDTGELADATPGYVGADLEALCREAAMSCLRRLLPKVDLAARDIPYGLLLQLEVHMGDFRNALREVQPSALREVAVEVPAVAWDQVGGLASVKRQLAEAVDWPLRHPELLRQAGVRPPRGILLSGPPGCGKTLLGRAMATQARVNFIPVKGPALFSKYVGESEKAVREVFRTARRAAPCILMFDEIDALVASRGAGFDSGVGDRVIGQFLSEMDGVEPLSGVLVLGATNRPDLLDPALRRPGRFDLVLEVGPPDAAARKEIFAINLKGRPVHSDLPIDQWAARTDGLTGADIEAICSRAAMSAVREAVAANTGRVLITRKHIEEALAGRLK